jgi:probable F420-dependent oxidoreductase
MLGLGLGVGYPEKAAAVGREFGRPLATMRDYLDRMEAPNVPPAADGGLLRILAANQPRMLALAAERADGALPAFLPAASTAQARKVLGLDKLLVVGVSVIMDLEDVQAARATACDSVAASLARPWFAAAVRGFGYTEQQIERVDDAIVDAIVADGTPESIRATVRGHLAAGADHVVLMPSPTPDLLAGVELIERLAPALLSA